MLENDFPTNLDLANEHHQYLMMQFFKRVFSSLHGVDYAIIISDRNEMALFNNLTSKEEIAQILTEAYAGVCDEATEYKVPQDKRELH